MDEQIKSQKNNTEIIRNILKECYWDYNISENDILNTCEKQGIEYKRVVQAKDFQRVMMNDFLQLDFVNDRVHREGKSNVINGMRIDNKLNILTNKIVAILNRDEEKDSIANIFIFKQARVEYGTVVWPNEVDIAPETLYLESKKIS